MQSDVINWGAAIALSLLVHSMLFTGGNTRLGLVNETVLQAPLITRLSFNVPVEKSQPVQQVEPVPDRQIPRPIKKIEPEPVRKKPVRKVPDKHAPPVQRSETVKKVEPVRQAVEPPQIQTQKPSHSSEGVWQHQRLRYLQKLLSHIESFKYYPRAARRRSLEGEVKISFLLRDDGYYEQLSVDGRHAILEKAARHSIESALPLPAPPGDAGFSRQVEFVMVYSLKN